jgi:putative glutathione S-transferase
MGQLIDGVWQQGWTTPDKHGGFQRAPTVFRDRAIAPVAGRYHLYAAFACPWAHRTLITRALRGLEGVVQVTMMKPQMGEDGWVFDGGMLREVYLRTDPKFTGRVTVPVLWDQEKKTIVNNESREVMRMLDQWELATGDTLAPPELIPEIDRILDAIYEPLNNGVYRAGFAKSQQAYERGVADVFAALAHWNEHLAMRPYLCGDRLTEADIAMFTTLLRFDLVYYSHFKCNVKRLRDHEHLWAFLRRMWANPKIRGTCNLDEIKTHYYWSQNNINPTRVVPVGPADYEASLG